MLRFGFDPGTDVFGFIFHLGVVLVMVEPYGLFGWRLENQINAFFWVCVCHYHVKPSNLDGHNFFFRTLIWVFLDSTESPLSLESGHMHVNGIWGPHIF